MDKKTNTLTATLLIVYLIVLCWILILKLGVEFSYMSERRFNILPFKEFFTPSLAVDWGGTIANVLIFIPLGVYVGVLFRLWSFAGKIIFCFMTSLIIEAIQFALAVGAFDITDIITNTFGGVVGLMLFNAVAHISGSDTSAQRLINVIATIGTVLMVALLIMLKIDLLPIKYH
jgi:glycopeptide antibiotics resistance protein